MSKRGMPVAAVCAAFAVSLTLAQDPLVDHIASQIDRANVTAVRGG